MKKGEKWVLNAYKRGQKLEKWSKVVYSGVTLLKRWLVFFLESEMLIGRYDNSIDAKGRVIIPAKFRNDIETQCILTSGLDGCLYLYSIQAWGIFLEKLEGLPESDENVRAFKRHFFSSVAICDVDKQGRLTIPPDSRKFAKIEKDLVTIGFGNKAEIWSKEVFNKEKEPSNLDANAYAAHVAVYGKI